MMVVATIVGSLFFCVGFVSGAIAFVWIDRVSHDGDDA